jgi:hypothetical protein
MVSATEATWSICDDSDAADADAHATHRWRAPRKRRNLGYLGLFQNYAYNAGLRLLRDGTLETVTLKSVIDTFRAAHPAEPVFMKSYAARDEWLRAVHTGDINRMALQRATTDVNVAKTMEKKLALRPKLKVLLKPKVEWCMDWILQERAAGRKPSRTTLQSV